MSAKAIAADETATESTVDENIFISIRDDPILTRPEGNAHLFESREGTALCGHPSTASDERTSPSEAEHGMNPVGDHNVCGNCSRALRARIGDGTLSTGKRLLDLALRVDAGDKLVVNVDGRDRRMEVTETEFSHGRIKVRGVRTDKLAITPVHYTDSMKISVFPDGAIDEIVTDGDLLGSVGAEERSYSTGDVSRPIATDGGVSTDEHNTSNRDLDTLEPIAHDYDCVGEKVIGACVECGHESSCRLLRKDYDREEIFKQSMVEGDDDYIPTELWRFCEGCYSKQTHLVC